MKRFLRWSGGTVPRLGVRVYYFCEFASPDLAKQWLSTCQGLFASPEKKFKLLKHRPRNRPGVVYREAVPFTIF